MSNLLLYFAIVLFGAALEATRQYTIRQNKAENGAGNGNDVGKFRAELLAEHRQLKAQTEEWQRKYYEERDGRLKAEWQLEMLKKLEAQLKAEKDADMEDN